MVDIAVRRGDIILVDFGVAPPFEVANKRPAIVISNNSQDALLK